jgi:hypothetical protein
MLMSRPVGNPQSGQWYLRWDTRELFQVTGLDEQSGTIELQNFDGDLSEIELASWHLLPLALAEPPQFNCLTEEAGDDTGSEWDSRDDGCGAPRHSRAQVLEQWERGE